MAWDWFKGLIRREGTELFTAWLDAQPIDAALDGYFTQVRLVDMHLGRSRDFGRDRFPLLQSVVGAPGSGIEVPMTVGPSAFSEIGDGRFKWAEQSNLPLTGLLPFDKQRGELRILCGLLYVTGSGLLTEAAGFLGTLSELVQVPQLSAAATIATKVAEGAEKIVSFADPKGRLALETSIRYEDLREGYLVIAASDEDDLDDSAMSIHGDPPSLDYNGSLDIDSLDYVVLKVDVSDEAGESFTQIATIHDPFDESLRLLASSSEESLAESEAQLVSAISAALRSIDLTVRERTRVAEILKDRWLRARKLTELPEEAAQLDMVVERMFAKYPTP